MFDEIEGTDGKDEHVALPGTLAWAARACEKAVEQKPTLWRIRPEVLLTPRVRLAPAGRNDALSGSGGSNRQNEEKKS